MDKTQIWAPLSTRNRFDVDFPLIWASTKGRREEDLGKRQEKSEKIWRKEEQKFFDLLRIRVRKLGALFTH